MKKIVIIPTFCESHLIKYQIDNIVDTIDPDYIIYNEGIFPRGPEGSTIVNENFIKNYTLDGKRGFDYLELVSIVDDAKKKYPDKNIILNEMNYDVTSAPHCYYQGCSNFKDLGIKIERGDLIFPYEGDVFHLESDAAKIQNYANELKPDSGFKTYWIDFLETQYYAEKNTMKPFILNQPGRSRRVCICYGTDEFYKNVLLNFMTQNYPMLELKDIVTYHYAWFRPGKYKQLRYDQLNRASIYWKNFEEALQKIRKTGKQSIGEVVVRPSISEGTARYAYYVDIEHPEAIKNHECYIK